MKGDDADVVVVTGGAAGIGAATVDAFVADGARVASFDLDRPASARDGVLDVEVDVADEESVSSAFARIGAQTGRIDVLVNNAGLQRVGATAAMATETWDLVVDTHLRGSFLCARAAIPLFDPQRGGAIVNVSSVAASQGLPGRAPYSAAKAGLLGLTRSLAVELAPQGVRVNAVAPGHTRTAMADRAIAAGVVHPDQLVQRIPLGRLARPVEIARVVRFLAGPDASYITGECIVVDGGWSVQGLIGRPAGV
jgi:NAD(P)-dependent dehydrogenase (short-subunit alcohol dehydrogenase family)